MSFIRGFARRNGSRQAPAGIVGLKKREKWYRCNKCAGKFRGRNPICPACGRTRPHVSRVVLIHLLQPHDDGPIHGQDDNWRIACDIRRDYIATHADCGHGETNLEQGTPNLNVVNCPDCLATLNLTLADVAQESELILWP